MTDRLTFRIPTKLPIVPVMDGYTILVVLLIMCGLISIGWLIAAFNLPEERHAMFYWAIVNMMVVCSVSLYSWRGIGPDYLTYAICNVFSILGMASLWRGFLIFTRQPKIDTLQLPLILIASAVNLLYQEIPHGWHIATTVTSGMWALHLGGAAFSGYVYMRQEFSRASSFFVISPLAVMTILFAAGTYTTARNGVEHWADLRSQDIVNVVYLITMHFSILLANVSKAGLVISRLVSKIVHLTIEDPLTKVANRRCIESLIGSELIRSERTQSPFSLVMLDIDHFKSVNDRYGHSAGDEALKMCAKALQSAIRTSDTVGRLGGEEFCVLLPTTDREGAITAAERMRACIEKLELHWNGVRIPLTASFGVVTCHDPKGQNLSYLFKAVDDALYEAKNNGRNRVMVAKPLVATPKIA